MYYVRSVGSPATLTMYDSFGDGGGSLTINGEIYILPNVIFGISDEISFDLCLDLAVCTQYYLNQQIVS